MESVLTALGTLNDMLKILLQMKRVCQLSRILHSLSTMLYIRFKLELRTVGLSVTGNLKL
jgi:hypothetical protein